MTKFSDYFSCIGQTISILTENINMQMESEFADSIDRKLISLYGVKNKKPTKMDLAGTEAQMMINESNGNFDSPT